MDKNVAKDVRLPAAPTGCAGSARPSPPQNGAIPHQFKAIFGWNTLAQAELYTKAVQQRPMVPWTCWCSRPAAREWLHRVSNPKNVAMAESANLEVDGDTKHIRDLGDLIQKPNPLDMSLKSIKNDTYSTVPKEYEAIMNDLALIVGDIVHNLRFALSCLLGIVVGTDRDRFSGHYEFVKYPM